MESTETFQALLPEEAQTLVAVMKRIVPHNDATLQELVWKTAMAYDAQLVAHVSTRQEVRKNLRELDMQARQTHAKPFAEIPPDTQDAMLKTIEDTSFFQSLVNATISDFYNRYAVWAALGYPGLAQRDGAGYLHKGYDHLSWD
ncbi:MAG: gluconate 2-dehydrogenase subunit 3 family protein [Firmicutes bacterium]|nr:gluconate 2-dehydrogenase subunit 3 family protein [Bacillota bacterium]